MERILSMNEYLDKNPNATLKDYVDYSENIRNAQHTRKKIVEDNFNNWLKEQEGKWFLINFNNTSYLLSKASFLNCGCKGIAFLRNHQTFFRLFSIIFSLFLFLFLSLSLFIC